MSRKNETQAEIGNHCAIHYFSGELMDGLVVVLFASSVGEWNDYVMIEFRVLVIMSQKNETQTKNRTPLRNTLFSSRADGWPCCCFVC